MKAVGIIRKSSREGKIGCTKSEDPKILPEVNEIINAQNRIEINSIQFIGATEGTKRYATFCCQILDISRKKMLNLPITKHHPALPLYTEQDAKDCLQYFKTAPWHKKVKLSQDISLSI